MQQDDAEDSEKQALEAVAEMKGELKAYLRMIDRSDAPIPVAEMREALGIRDLVSLNRELEKQAEGEPFNELVVGHAEVLKQSAIAKLSASSALKNTAQQPARTRRPLSAIKRAMRLTSRKRPRWLIPNCVLKPSAVRPTTLP